MAKQYQIYLSGGMMKFGNDNFDEGNKWREYCRQALEECESPYKVTVFNPNEYFSFKEGAPEYSSELEVMRFDLHNLRKSDLVIVNYNDKKSLGTTSEVAIAYERGIPIIALNEDGGELHPWLRCMPERIFDDIDKMLDYIEDFYLR